MAPTKLQHTGAMPRNADAAAASSAPQNTTAIAIGVSVGAVILLAAAFIILRIVRARRAHRRAIAAIEQANGMPVALRQDMLEVPRPASGCSASRFAPLSTQRGWDALGSSDTINEPQPVARAGKRERATVSMPKRVKSRGIPLKPFKHLSAIIESPRVQQERLPTPKMSERKTSFGLPQVQFVQDVHPAHREEALPAPDSPKPTVGPSFAIRSPGRYGAAIANGNLKARAPRSVSTGVLTDYVSDGAVFGSEEPMPNMAKRRGPPLHIRSVSLGAPPSRPPSGPVPPLPVLSPLETDFDKARKGVCISRMSSSSSNGSTGSSVLVTSPILERNNTDSPVISPTVEEVVDDDNGALKTVIKHQWQDPPVSEAKPISNTKAGRHARARSSVRGRIVRSSTDSVVPQHLRQTSSSSISSCGSGGNRLSIPLFGTAERVSMSRVSSSNSLASNGGIQKIETPTKRVRRQSSVSMYGSPAERRRTSALRDISGNAVLHKNTPTREPSQSTITSSRSSNGNPFHWDTQSSNVSPKPSALKGSPNARKGQKRQKSCVRISTLTPEVLGPSRSRSTSPAGLMDKIKEERESEEMDRQQPSRRETSMYLARSAKPPSASASTDNLRIQTLRASLTPSSPTLSTWNAYQEASALPSQYSDSNLTNLTVSPVYISRAASRQSDRSFSIPKFPSPARKSQATVSPVAIDTAPMPEFAPACPTSDEAEETHSSSLFALDMSSEGAAPVDIPSSPPLPLSKSQEYDPAWPMITFAPTIPASSEYDPASPPSVMVDDADSGVRSSLFLPFAVDNMPFDDPSSRPTSYSGAPVNSIRDSAIQEEDSPPCSPKTIPVAQFSDLPVIPPKNRRREERRETRKLTSENAGSIMSRSKTAPQLGFPGVVPVLAPTTQYDEDQDLPRWEPSYIDIDLAEEEGEEEEITPRALTTEMRVARAPSLSTIPQSSSSPPPAARSSIIPSPASAYKRTPSPLATTTTRPQERASPSPIMGPRAAPAQSMLKNAMALRRMNSEVKCHRSRESRTYVRLGREPSPLLPWIGGIPTTEMGSTEEGAESLFDFDFEDSSQESTPGRIPAVGARKNNSGDTTAMDEIDFEAFDRQIDGALKGFQAEFEFEDFGTRSGSFKENQSPTDGGRRSSVWDDGEKFWGNQDERQSRPGTSGGLFPAYTHATPNKQGLGLKEGIVTSTLDAGMLSTPGGKVKGSSPMAMSTMGSVAATPKSLYDNDGFLRA